MWYFQSCYNNNFQIISDILETNQIKILSYNFIKTNYKAATISVKKHWNIKVHPGTPQPICVSYRKWHTIFISFYQKRIWRFLDKYSAITFCL